MHKNVKNGLKPKRSVKQLANDRRLGRMAKKRGKKKRGKKKATRRKNPVHTVHQVAMWSPTAKKVAYYDGVGFTLLRRDAAGYGSQKIATKVARNCGKRCAIITNKNSAESIRAALTGKV